jgi:hypothetical protein
LLLGSIAHFASSCCYNEQIVEHHERHRAKVAGGWKYTQHAIDKSAANPNERSSLDVFVNGSVVRGHVLTQDARLGYLKYYQAVLSTGWASFYV